MKTPLKVNRQIWGDKLKSVLEFNICHVISRMRNDDLALCLWEHKVWGRISRKPLEIETWHQQTTNRKWPAANRITDATNDVKWPWNVKVAWPSVRLVEPNISTMAGNRRSVPMNPMNHQYEMGYGESNRKSYYWQPTGSRTWEIDWYQHERPWPLFRGRLRSCQP